MGILEQRERSGESLRVIRRRGARAGPAGGVPELRYGRRVFESGVVRGVRLSQRLGEGEIGLGARDARRRRRR